MKQTIYLKSENLMGSKRDQRKCLPTNPIGAVIVEDEMTECLERANCTPHGIGTDGCVLLRYSQLVLKLFIEIKIEAMIKN